MNWRVKALMQSFLSRLPLGHELNYFLRRHVSRTVPAADNVFAYDCRFAAEHINAFRKRGACPIEDALFYEFGVGWDLTIPLAFYSLGVNRQLVVDLRRLIKVALVRRSAGRLAASGEKFDLVRTPESISNVTNRAQLVETLRLGYGIDYRAPFDARNTDLVSTCIDYITATKVLAQIPEASLRDILLECYRILRPGGLIRVLNDYRDAYSYVDSKISVYNFLRFSDDEWERLNPDLNYQNRLRHVDYLRLFHEAGFEVQENEAGYDADASIEVLKQIPLADKFRRYSLDDLMPVRGVILGRKPDSSWSGRYCGSPTDHPGPTPWQTATFRRME
jgi:SAM-dependent methyltransferase